jgi:hypothetical protein
MGPPGVWHNPITVVPGQTQRGVDPRALLPSRKDLLKARFDFQRLLIRSDQARLTPIQVTEAGVIYDGHHAVRAAAQEGILVDVLVVDQKVPPSGPSILALPIR